LKFSIPTWVPLERLTPEERDENLHDQTFKPQLAETEQGNNNAASEMNPEPQHPNHPNAGVEGSGEKMNTQPQLQFHTSPPPQAGANNNTIGVQNIEAKVPESSGGDGVEESSEPPTKRVKLDIPQEKNPTGTDTGVSSLLEAAVATKTGGSAPAAESNAAVDAATSTAELSSSGTPASDVRAGPF
jgi:hypothetical protein